ncbi:unnamed protein product [Lymnaea stagnalis]|uniref:Palmitoyltransferase n=1 Tax=Lymnaea stagnalis TaxID=6523 RepID=A0AAV2HG10_LYMST
MADSLLGRGGYTFAPQGQASVEMNGHSHVSLPIYSNKTVQRAPRSSNMPSYGDATGDNQSLVSKLKAHYKNRSATDTNSKHFFRILFQFQAITQLYMTLNYIIPYVFSEFEPTSQYYLKVFACYVFTMGQANWLCSICYSSRLPDMRDRPNLDFREWFENPPETFGQNGIIKTNLHTMDENGLEWRYCSKCERYKPPRAHHCDACRMCVLRRDHHCFLIGKCIGHFNQRYFIVFCFLGVFTGLIGFILTVTYLISLPDPVTWVDYVFPWSLFKFLIGKVSWQFVLLTFHAEMLAVFGGMSVIYGIGQMSIVCLGFTLYEVAKSVDVKVTSSRAENIRMVFGDYWGLNFLFPAQILFKQRHDGMHYDNIKIGNNKVSVE